MKVKNNIIKKDMNKVKKEELDSILKRHNDKNTIENMQTIVNRLIEAGFTISTKELHDLSCVCALLTKQAEEMAKSKENQREAYMRLGAEINAATYAMREALLYHTSTPLDADAYEIVDNCVVLSQTWAEKKAQEYITRPKNNSYAWNP
mgnify:CR=1 FL=1